MKRLSLKWTRFASYFQFEKSTESGNTGVIAQTRILSLKGRGSGRSGLTSGARKRMSSQVTTGAGLKSFRRYAAKTASALAAFALILALTVTAIGPTSSRANADHAPLQALFGNVVEVSLPDTLTVATDSGVVEVIVPDSTVFTGTITAVEDISEGDRIVGSIHVAEDGTITADRILIVPNSNNTVTQHILGVILDYEDDVVVMQDSDGSTISIDVPEGVDVPEIGTVVTAIAQLDRTTGRLLAQTFELVEDVVQRLQEALDRATDEDQIKALEELLERARDQHLSALERAREALERAQNAVQAAIEEREEAERRLREVQAQFDALRLRYVQEASDRNERLPQLRIEGLIGFDAEEWLEPTGMFTLKPRINDADDSITRTFTWDEETLAIIPVEVRESDPDTPAVTTTTARSVALPLNDVKSLIPAGSSVLVQYDPNTEPALATLVTVLPPEIPDAIEDALENERLRSISGFITLVEETPNLTGTTGVIVVTNREHDVKVAVKVVGSTQIEIDGQLAMFSDLAAGMSVDVDFAEAEVVDDETQTTLSGRLNALRVRASSQVDTNEVHVAGVIAGLDSDSRTIGVLTRDGEVLRARVSDDAVIVKDGEVSRFGAVETGDLVLDATRFNRETTVFTRLVVQSPRAIDLTGTITGVDRNPNRIKVTTSSGDVIVVFITSSTRISDEDGDLLEPTDIEVGNRLIKGQVMPVQLDDRTVLVATEMVVGTAVITTARGVVNSVDAESGVLGVTTDSAVVLSGGRQIQLRVAENNRSIIFKNEVQIRTLDTVEVGDIVESVSFVRATGDIVRISVVSPNLQRTRGVVSGITADGINVETRDGRAIALGINDETVVTLNGRRIDSVRLIRRGDTVANALYVAREDDPTQGTALRITVFSDDVNAVTPGTDGNVAAVETSLSGVILEITAETWTIGDRTFLVNSDTRLFGERPAVGLVAKATLILNADGQFVATSISVAGRPDTNPSTRPADVQPAEPGDGDGHTGLVRILGKVQAVEEIDDGNIIVVVDGVKILVISNTVIVGEPTVGSNALAVVRRSAAGNVTAVTIIFTGSDGTVVGTGELPSLTPTPSPTPEPTEPDDGSTNTPGAGDEDGDNDANNSDPSTGEDGSNSGPSAAGTDDVTSVTIVVEEISGRVVFAEERLYFLKASQVINLRVGDSITVDVREVDVDELGDLLSLVDRAVIVTNPLYEAKTSEGVSAIYVAE